MTSTTPPASRDCLLAARNAVAAAEAAVALFIKTAAAELAPYGYTVFYDGDEDYWGAKRGDQEVACCDSEELAWELALCNHDGVPWSPWTPRDAGLSPA